MAASDAEAPAKGKAPAADTEPKSKRSMTPVLVAGYVAVSIAGMAFAERVIVPAFSHRAPSPVAAEEHAPEKEAKKHAKKKGGGGHGAKADAEEGGNVYLVEDLVLNPAGSGQRYLAISVALESSEPDFAVEGKSSDARIRDALIRILGSKTAEELANVKTREEVRGVIQSEVTSLLAGHQVEAVYFTRFVLQ